MTIKHGKFIPGTKIGFSSGDKEQLWFDSTQIYAAYIKNNELFVRCGFDHDNDISIEKFTDPNTEDKKLEEFLKLISAPSMLTTPPGGGGNQMLTSDLRPLPEKPRKS